MYQYEPECYNMDECEKYMPTPIFEKGPQISNPLLEQEPEEEPKIIVKKKCAMDIFNETLETISPFKDLTINVVLILFICVFFVYLLKD